MRARVMVMAMMALAAIGLMPAAGRATAAEPTAPATSSPPSMKSPSAPAAPSRPSDADGLPNTNPNTAKAPSPSGGKPASTSVSAATPPPPILTTHAQKGVLRDAAPRPATCSLAGATSRSVPTTLRSRTQSRSMPAPAE